MFARAGKAKAFLKTKCVQEASASCTNKPDWILKVVDDTQAVTVGKISGDAKVERDTAGCMTAFKITTADLEQAFASFKG